MTFAAAERAYLAAPEPDSCTRCEDDPDMDHDECIEAAADAYDDALLARQEERDGR